MGGTIQRWRRVLLAGCFSVTSALAEPKVPLDFVNWESAPVHPLALSPDDQRLAACNTPDARVELFSIGSNSLVHVSSIPVGLDPVAVRFRTATELWVANYISDSISVIDLEQRRVVATIATPNEPADVVFAGTPERAFVTCAQPNLLLVLDPNTRQISRTLSLSGNRPKAMAASLDGKTLFISFFESGNGSTILAPRLTPLDNLPPASVVDFPNGPHHGLNPAPNDGDVFTPARVVTNTPPRVSLIVKKNSSGRWLDDSKGDWTEYVTGTNAIFSGRTQGWDLPDHDVAVVNTGTLAIHYVSSLMNICMDLAVNPVSGSLIVVGTDAINEVRFEPVLNGKFVRSRLALVSAAGGTPVIRDLNPHLTYEVMTLPEAERSLSIGDPRSVIWNSEGTRAYVAGMGSSNIVVLDDAGNRAGSKLIDVEEGPSGLALDEGAHRLYVLNRFAASISIVDTETERVVGKAAFFDPTPQIVKAGRRHFFDTHATSGLGQAACASCHVDARFDHLAWDLGTPAGAMQSATNRNFGRFPPQTVAAFHPMKGPMVTQTLQDIIGHEPFHWRGDRDGIEQFNQTFTNLQAAAQALTTNELVELKTFLATVRMPPNPFRLLDNSLPSRLPLPGFFSLGRGSTAPGTPLPDGRPQAGLDRFRQAGPIGCIHCHVLPAGLGSSLQWTGTRWQTIPPGTNSESHLALILTARSAEIPFKIPSLRNLYDKIGLDYSSSSSTAGFGFFHDGRVANLVQFLQDGFDFRSDQETADVIAFLLCITGADLPAGALTDPDRPPGVPIQDVPAGIGNQITTTNATTNATITLMLALARTNKADLVVRGPYQGLQRSWLFDHNLRIFQSNRHAETNSVDELRAAAGPGLEFTWMLVPLGAGRRLGLDRDRDGFLDQDEIDAGTDPTDPNSFPAPRIAIRWPAADLRSFEFSWPASPGRQYQVQVKHGWEGNWTALHDAAIADSEIMIQSELIEAGDGERFYRVELLPLATPGAP